MFDVFFYLFSAAIVLVVVGLPLMIASSAIPTAVGSVLPGRHGWSAGRAAVVGLLVSGAGGALMWLGAWETREDGRQSSIHTLGWLIVTLLGTGILTAGFGPLPAWLLQVFGRVGERLPLPFRMAARDLASRRTRAVVAITLTMLVSGLGIGLTVVAVGMTTQSRAEFLPEGRSGALVVRPAAPYLGPFSAAEAATVRAAIEREVPGVRIITNEEIPIDTQSLRTDVQGFETPETAVYWDQVIGDEALLRYLTGDQATPYDEGKAVAVTSGTKKFDTIRLSYPAHKGDQNDVIKFVPVMTAKAAEPAMQTIFLPSKLARDLGFQPQAGQLIIDPTVHRVTKDEQERIDDRLDDELARVYVERGFQPSLGWVPFAGALLLGAVALSAGFGGKADARRARVLRRVGASYRSFRAARAGVTGLCGVVLGAVAGCPAGIAVLWPLTESGTWDDPPRVPFETPWLAIAAIVVCLPVLSALASQATRRPRAPK